MKRMINDGSSSSEDNESRINNSKKRSHTLRYDNESINYYSSNESDENGETTGLYIDSDHTLFSSSSGDEEEEEEDDLKANKVPRAPTTRPKSVQKRRAHGRDDEKQTRILRDTEFQSAYDSTSVYSSIKDTERGLNSLIIKKDRIDEIAPREVILQFYSKLLPVFIKTHLLLIELISIPEEFLHTIVKGQGVRKYFTFENVRIFNLDNATLLLDHRYLKKQRSIEDFIIKVVGCPVNSKLAIFPKTLTTDTNVFTGAGDKIIPCRHFVRSHVLRDNFSLKRPASTGGSNLMGHHFSLNVPPPGFWWNTYDTAVPSRGDFKLKIQEAVQERPIFVDVLFLLGTVGDKENTIDRVRGTARWEPLNMKETVDRAAITIHTMLCFGFRILSFGMLCEYTKTATGDWIKGHGETNEREHRQAYAAKRRRQTNAYKYEDTSVSSVKKRAVMRMVYALDSIAAVNIFFRIMDTHASTMKKRVVRSRLFYKKTTRWDVVGRSYVYPNNSLYMVLGSCNIVYSYREMSVCTKSLTTSLLDKLNDRSRDDFDTVEEKSVTGLKTPRTTQKQKVVTIGSDTSGILAQKRYPNESGSKRPLATTSNAATDDLVKTKRPATRKTITRTGAVAPSRDTDSPKERATVSRASNIIKPTANVETRSSVKRVKTDTRPRKKIMSVKKPLTLSTAPLPTLPLSMEKGD